MSDLNEDHNHSAVHPEPKVLWSNRRKMAWSAFLTIVGYTVFIMTISVVGVVPEPILQMLINFGGMLFLAMTGIVGAYLGFSTQESITKFKIEKEK